MSRQNAIIVAARRTPIGRAGGVLSHMDIYDLMRPLCTAVLQDACIDSSAVDEVVLGNVLGPGGNPARYAALDAGFGVDVPGVTVDRQCGSGLSALTFAARLIESGAADVVVAGGVESASTAPWRLRKPQNPAALPQFYARSSFSPAAIGDPDMGVAAENVARRYGIDRARQDAYALSSHRKATASQKENRFSEMVPLARHDGSAVTQDECPRTNTSIEVLSKLKPVFQDDGTVTAGNACPINDGAALTVIVSETVWDDLHLKKALRIVDTAVSGVDPNLLGIGPVAAVRKLLARNADLAIDDIDVVEFNEAFASQVLASLDELGISEAKVNVGGGAIALGHPYGASGAILMTRLFAEMLTGPNKDHYKRGLATIGIGGGMGEAIIVEAL